MKRAIPRPALDESLPDYRLDLETPLHPGTASAALIIVEGQYLLQLRDNMQGIFFPSHWGCFGGASEMGESPLQALVRELKEELGLEAQPGQLEYFTNFEFDLGFAGLAPIHRTIFEIELDAATHAGLALGEGSAMQLFDAAAILTGSIQLTPYDAFALWLHINAKRLR